MSEEDPIGLAVLWGLENRARVAEASLQEARTMWADWQASSESYRGEVDRLQDAKRRALSIADERAKENVAFRAEVERLKHSLKHHENTDREIEVQNTEIQRLREQVAAQRALGNLLGARVERLTGVLMGVMAWVDPDNEPQLRTRAEVMALLRKDLTACTSTHHEQSQPLALTIDDVPCCGSENDPGSSKRS